MITKEQLKTTAYLMTLFWQICMTCKPWFCAFNKQIFKTKWNNGKNNRQKKKFKPKDLYNLKGDAIVNASYNVLSQISLEKKKH